MGTKNKPGEFDCYENAASNEPMFVLLARDPAAADLVEAWALQREVGSMSSPPLTERDRRKIAEARKCAKAMRAWRKRHR